MRAGLHDVPDIPDEILDGLRSAAPDEGAVWLWQALWAYEHALGVDGFTVAEISLCLKQRRRYPHDPIAGGIAAAVRRRRQWWRR